MKQKYINLSSFRSNMLEALIQFSAIKDLEPEESCELRTEEDWWEEFKLYMEDNQ